MDPREVAHEQRQREADRVALERAGAARREAGTAAPGYVHFGELVYVPGELLPAEVAEAFRAQQPEPDPSNVYRLTPPKGRRAPRKETT
jgi:hypothetical protein